MKLSLAVIFVLSTILILGFTSEEVGNDTGSVVSFKTDVFPIIEEHCLPCHAAAERNMSRLFLDNYELLMKGGYNGPPVRPGDAGRSLLIQKLLSNPPFGERMPQRSTRYLTEEEINLIKTWIKEGAKNN